MELCDNRRSVGPVVALSACILELFKLFFTPALIDLIVEQTNLYASRTMNDEQHTKCEDVTAEDIFGVYGLYDTYGNPSLTSASAFAICFRIKYTDVVHMMQPVNAI